MGGGGVGGEREGYVIKFCAIRVTSWITCFTGLQSVYHCLQSMARFQLACVRGFVSDLAEQQKIS